MKQVTESELALIDRPDFTDTWSPWHHSDVLAQVNTQLTDMGLEPMDNHMEVSDNGMDLFGHMTIAKFDNDGLAPTMRHAKKLGWRNSMQKRFGLGFVAGDEIYVCSNLGFYGDYRETHIHNAQLDEERLKQFIRQAIASVWKEMENFDNWFSKMSEMQISFDELRVLAYDMMDRDILPPSKFKLFQTSLNEERATQKHLHRHSMAHLHGAVTRTLRGGSINKTMRRTRDLAAYMQELTPALVVTEDDLVI